MNAMRKYSDDILVQKFDSKEGEPCESLKTFGVGDKQNR